MSIKNKVLVWVVTKILLHIKANPKKEPVGIPGRRDPEAHCSGYYPKTSSRYTRVLSAFYCSGDGHYLCNRCLHYIPDFDNELNAVNSAPEEVRIISMPEAANK